ncbi:hypothetical protein [Paenibacillus macerans]|nr:hypothetical protein [Paenibacillus macerans]MDU5946977.1 hypothetical protein [Paenibacillus macerans]
MKRTSRFMRTLTADIHFYTAKMNQTPIVVFIDGELIGSGRIKEITKVSVKIGDDMFLRAVCTFKYAV